jgi:penicillin-binding protein activator
MARFAVIVRVGILALLATTLFLGGCASGGGRPGGVAEANPSASGELKRMAVTMTQSLLQTPTIAAQSPPTVAVQEIQNATRDGIDTRSVTDAILGELYRSAKVRLAADAGATEKGPQKTSPQPQEVSPQGNAAGAVEGAIAQFRIEGSVGSMVKDAQDGKGVYYRLSIQLRNMASGAVEYADEKVIRRPPVEDEPHRGPSSGMGPGSSRRGGGRW